MYQEVMRNSNLSVEAKAIYAYLSSIAGIKNTCYPSVETIQTDLCMGKNRLMKHMGQLIAAGVVEKVRERNGNIYGRNIYKITHETEVAKDLNRIFEAVENEALEIQAVENEVINNNNTNNNIKNKNSIKGKSSKTVKVYFPNDELLNQAFADYVEMRKQIRKPMTDKAVTLAIKKLQELSAIPFSDTIDSEMAIQILNQSIMNSWQGLFPLKEDRKREKGGAAVGSGNQSRRQAADFYEQFMGAGNGD